jgi:hypothetical protein
MEALGGDMTIASVSHKQLGERQTLARRPQTGAGKPRGRAGGPGVVAGRS